MILLAQERDILCEEQLTIRESENIEDSEPNPSLPSNVRDCDGSSVDSKESHEPLRGNA
jgi:hypothetical protein